MAAIAPKKKPVTSAPGPRMLNVTAAAEYTGATVWFIRTLAWEKKVPSVILGNRLLFDRADLDAFIDRAKAGAA
jgi:excisionase family DNA binding protein